ncbi:HTH_Tnp_Tc3_2 domain-containing protein [Trichonephila clavipes]|nr:HTH_Tnp_Tc3_2 domain-containing protein [Trichonephila clavipes]
MDWAGGLVNWQARSPLLSCIGFFLWGHMKSLVYASPDDSYEVLAARITIVAGEFREMPGVFANVRHSLSRWFFDLIDLEAQMSKHAPLMRKHLDAFLRGRIIGQLKCGRTQLEVSEELGIGQSVISRRWQQFQDDVTAKRNSRSTASEPSRQLSSAAGTTVSRQTMLRRLGHIGLYARRSVRFVPLTATHCRQRLTWSGVHALWTPQQWPCVMFSDGFRFSLQSDSRQTLIWRALGTCYHKENTIELNVTVVQYGSNGEEILLVPELICMFRV